MTLISVVLPVNDGVAPYLRNCLDSILARPAFGDFEVVAVDASLDGSGEILDEYALRYPALRVEHLDPGAGTAHGVGFELAKGEYIWWMDGGDALLPWALDAVSAALSSSDLLLVGYTRDAWPMVLPPTPPTFTAAECPAVFSFPHGAWSRVIRRELVGRAGFPFHPGWYSDVSLTYPLTVAAQRISVLRRVCYQHRVRHPDTASERHFEVFDQYERVFATLDRWGVDAFATDAVRRYIFDRMVWHLPRVLERAAPGRQRAFFTRMSEHYQRFQPAHSRIRRSARTALKHRLIKTDSWRTYRALKPHLS